MVDALDLLREQHRKVERLFVDLERIEALATGGDDPMPNTRNSLVAGIIARIAAHSALEEQHVYPLLPDDLAERERAEHHEAQQTMSRLDGLAAQAQDFDPLMRKLIADVREHVRQEEAEVFPLLAGRLDTEARRELGETLQKALRLAPLHAHPHAPQAPPLNRLTGPLAGIVDRVREGINPQERAD